MSNLFKNRLQSNKNKELLKNLI